MITKTNEYLKMINNGSNLNLIDVICDIVSEYSRFIFNSKFLNKFESSFLEMFSKNQYQNHGFIRKYQSLILIKLEIAIISQNEISIIKFPIKIRAKEIFKNSNRNGSQIVITHNGCIYIENQIDPIIPNEFIYDDIAHIYNFSNDKIHIPIIDRFLERKNKIVGRYQLND